MTKLANIGQDASLVLVVELITQLERQREASRQPSLVAELQAAIDEVSVCEPQTSARLRVGMADAQLALEWVRDRLRPQDLHFGDLIAGHPHNDR